MRHLVVSAALLTACGGVDKTQGITGNTVTLDLQGPEDGPIEGTFGGAALGNTSTIVLLTQSLDDGAPGAFTVIDGKLRYDPAAAFNHLREGTTVQVTGHVTLQDTESKRESPSLPVIVTIIGTNDAPTGATLSLATSSLDVLHIDASQLAQDPDDDDALRVTAVSQPAVVGGTLQGTNLIVDGALTFTPADPSSGTHTFTVDVTDKTGSTVRVDVNIDVHVGQQVAINTFTTTPSYITGAIQAALQATTSHASNCKLLDGVNAPVVFDTPTIAVHPTVTTTYTLQCEGDGGPVSQQVTVKVGPALFVKSSATGAGDGSSWEDAFTAVSFAAGAAAGRAVDVWLAPEAYRATAVGQPVVTMTPGLRIFGGFEPTLTGTQGAIATRPREVSGALTHVSTLDGDRDDNGFSPGDSQHVVVAADDTVLDGVTITGGFAQGGGVGGAGLFADTVNNLQLDTVIITANAVRTTVGPAEALGGGVFLKQGSATFTHVSVVANEVKPTAAVAVSGGGIAIEGPATVDFNDVTVSANEITPPAGLLGSGDGLAAFGGGISCKPACSGTWDQLTVDNNSAIGSRGGNGSGSNNGGRGGRGRGGGMYAEPATLVIRNVHGGDNLAKGGAGGNGGSPTTGNQDGGDGGNSGAASGGALYFQNNGAETIHVDITTMTLENNLATTGVPGGGGNGSGTGLDGTDGQAGAVAGGPYGAFCTVLDLHSTVILTGNTPSAVDSICSVRAP